MKKRIIELIPIVCILVFVGLFFWQTFLLGKLPVPSDTLVGMYHPWLDFIAKEYPSGLPYKNFLITDPIRQQIPWRKLAIESLKEGKIHAWNSYSFSGTPLATNIQSGFFYPLNILFLFLPFPIAWTALIILQQILSGIFFYLFLKISIKLSSYTSLFGALCFMFCGFSTVWLTWGTIGQTLLWLPLLLVLFDALVTVKETKKRIIISTSLGVVLATQYFAGHSQVFLYSFFLFIAYALYRLIIDRFPHVSRKAVLTGLFGSILLCIILTSVHWIPFLSELQDSSRLQYGSLFKEEGFFLPFQNLVQFIVPDFFGNPATLNYWGIWNYGEFCGYIGIAGLFFALYAVFSKRTSVLVFWLSVTVISLLFALPTSVSKLSYTHHIPILSSLQPTRLLSIVDVGLCILAAIGFEAWMHSYRKKSLVVTVGIMVLFFGLVWYAVKLNPYGISKEQLDVTSRNVLFPSAICILIFVVLCIRTVLEMVIKRRNTIVSVAGAVLIIGISFFDLSRFGWKFTPFTDRALFFPKTQIISYLQDQERPYRITALDDRIMPPNVAGYYGIESISGYDPLYNSRYETFIAAMERGEANITPPYGFKRIITPKNIMSPLFRFLGVRFVLSLSDLKDSRFKKVFQEGQARVYEYTDFLPRTYLLDQIIYEKDEQKIISKLYEPSFRIGSEGIVEESMQLENRPLSVQENAHITAYGDNRINISVQTETPRLLYIGNLYHNGWKAYVDNLQVPIIRTNYLFMGIVIQKGAHTVSVKYENN